MNKLKNANKALVGAVSAAVVAAAPAVIDALNEWVASAIGLVVTGIAVYATRPAGPGSRTPDA